MPSSRFVNLAISVQELRRVYLDDALTSAVPTLDHQELARAFLTLAHAELEFYVEEACRALAEDALAAAVAGNYGKVSLAMITFSGLEPLRGGATVSSAGKKKARRLSTRFGAAYNVLIKAINGNNGVREKHLAALAIPLGLDVSDIDNTWLNELDAFCSSRGAFAHMSRITSRASHLAVNPHDVWQKCERLIWTTPALAAHGVINSFESLDQWFETQKQSFGPSVPVSAWRLKLTQLLLMCFARVWRREEPVVDDDDD